MDDLRASYSIKLLNTPGHSLINNFKGCDYCGENTKLKWCVTISSNAPSEFHWICVTCGHSGLILSDKTNIFKRLEQLSKTVDKDIIKALRLIESGSGSFQYQ